MTFRILTARQGESVHHVNWLLTAHKDHMWFPSFRFFLSFLYNFSAFFSDCTNKTFILENLVTTYKQKTKKKICILSNYKKVDT